MESGRQPIWVARRQRAQRRRGHSNRTAHSADNFSRPESVHQHIRRRASYRYAKQDCKPAQSLRQRGKGTREREGARLRPQEMCVHIHTSVRSARVRTMGAKLEASASRTLLSSSVTTSSSSGSTLSSASDTDSAMIKSAKTKTKTTRQSQKRLIQEHYHAPRPQNSRWHSTHC